MYSGIRTWHQRLKFQKVGPVAQGNAINYNLIRLADVILWRAECEVEASDFVSAEADVNLIRNRMASHPEYLGTYLCG